jgi:hypothetical protein
MFLGTPFKSWRRQESEFSIDLNYNPNKNNIEDNIDITIRPLPEIWRELLGA